MVAMRRENRGCRMDEVTLHYTVGPAVHEALGFEFAPCAFASATASDKTRAVFRANKVLAGLVYDTTFLEGNPFTFPEVQTLMDGITVGGHRIADADQVLNQAESWRALFRMVRADEFALDCPVGCQLHALVARNEALSWGAFRTGHVGIAGTEHEPPDSENLPSIFERGRQALGEINDVHARAMCAFLFVALNQFFWDGNRRTGRLLMNGELLSNGYDAITVPAARRVEFNRNMVAFYDGKNASDMMRFLASCSLDKTLRMDSPAAMRSRGRQR